MESEILVSNQYNQIDLSTVDNFLKTRQDCLDFCQKSNLYLPDLPIYNLDFVLAWASGKKMILKLSEAPIIRLGNCKKFDLLNKMSLFKIAINKIQTKSYIPDECSPEQITRDFLVTLLWSKFNSKYKELKAAFDEYCSYKQNISHKNLKVVISNDILSNLTNYHRNPRNRKMRSHIHKIKKSKYIKKDNSVNVN